MFGINISELLVCAVVALVVVGPQRLPEVIRTTALWIGRIKRNMHEVRENIEKQIGVEDIRRQLHTEEMMRTLDDMKEEIEIALNYERMGNKPALEDKSNSSVESTEVVAQPTTAITIQQLENTPELISAKALPSEIIFENNSSVTSSPALPDKQIPSTLIH